MKKTLCGLVLAATISMPALAQPTPRAAGIVAQAMAYHKACKPVTGDMPGMVFIKVMDLATATGFVVAEHAVAVKSIESELILEWLSGDTAKSCKAALDYLTKLVSTIP